MSSLFVHLYIILPILGYYTALYIVWPARPKPQHITLEFSKGGEGNGSIVGHINCIYTDIKIQYMQ